MKRAWNHIRLIWQTYGAYAALKDFCCVVFERLLSGHCLVILVVEPRTVYDAGKTYQNHYTMRFLSDDELLHMRQTNPEFFPPQFVSNAVTRGDRCFAVLDGNRPVSAKWYSRQTTPMGEGLSISVAADYGYVYHSYTEPAYRGQHLNCLGMSQVLAAFQPEGVHGMICYVALNNFASLKSCQRIGYRKLGYVISARLAGKQLIVHTPGCKRYGVSVSS